jgi:hypothetical protein
MSFRQKINGPMCFVEFEEVGYASVAIKELYGHNLVSGISIPLHITYGVASYNSATREPVLIPDRAASSKVESDYPTPKTH